jgi:hypothetical protein
LRIADLELGIWKLGIGIWNLEFGNWDLEFGIWFVSGQWQLPKISGWEGGLPRRFGGIKARGFVRRT